MLLSILRLAPANDVHVTCISTGDLYENPTWKGDSVTYQHSIAKAINSMILHDPFVDPIPASYAFNATQQSLLINRSDDYWLHQVASYAVLFLPSNSQLHAYSFMFFFCVTVA